MEMRPIEKKVTNLPAGVRRIFMKFYELVPLDIRKKDEKSKCHIGFSDHLITRDHKKPASVAGFSIGGVPEDDLLLLLAQTGVHPFKYLDSFWPIHIQKHSDINHCLSKTTF